MPKLVLKTASSDVECTRCWTWNVTSVTFFVDDRLGSDIPHVDINYSLLYNPRRKSWLWCFRDWWHTVTAKSWTLLKCLKKSQKQMSVGRTNGQWLRLGKRQLLKTHAYCHHGTKFLHCLSQKGRQAGICGHFRLGQNENFSYWPLISLLQNVKSFCVVRADFARRSTFWHYFPLNQTNPFSTCTPCGSICYSHKTLPKYARQWRPISSVCINSNAG